MDGDLQPVETHRSDNITVESQLSLGIQPKLYLTWHVEPSLWQQGCKLMVFHSTESFCPDERPEDLTRHGALVIEKRHDGNCEERLTEGNHFYTGVLSKLHLFGLFRSTEILRFRVNVPSAKVAIGRLQDVRTLRELRQEEILAPISFHTEVYERKTKRRSARRIYRKESHPSPEAVDHKPKNKAINEATNSVDAIIEAFLAKGQKMEEVQNDPRFAQLSKSERSKLFRRIKKVFDPAEILARTKQS
jgi:hypothetical protein